MQTGNPHSVAIIGGGLCGVLSLLQLEKQSSRKLKVSIFNKELPLFRGRAYQTYSEKHLLNVAARNMSVFPDSPGHFSDWAKRQKNYAAIEKKILDFSYLPRNLYGKYLDEILEDFYQFKREDLNTEIFEKEVVSLKKEQGMFKIGCSDGSFRYAKKVILASGNQLPRSPLPDSHSFNSSSLYIGNPWTEKGISGLSGNEPVLIIGTGLTMVDVVLGLLEKNFRGRILAISPKGFHILPHRPYHPYTGILEEIRKPYDLANLFSLFRKHVRLARLENKSGETVVDAIRPATQEIWQHLSLRDKKSFMSHVRHLWGVARHRLPSDIHLTINQLMAEGMLEIHAGRIKDIREENGLATVSVRMRGESESKDFKVQRVINCTGPEADPERFDSELFRQLLREGILAVDEMRLGVRADSSYNAISSEGEVDPDLYVIGSLLRGTLWESTAVPELRVQAYAIAGRIMNT